ncbi:MOSC domain-containing protein [Micromonospora sp. ATCC 39149]|uniref:MOSC domain-containing protein n=1 Tax=Micromonospora carbonacea TaxID=47853 RepID=A0A7D6CE66_9ACTN|nr:MOSC N-terminal beta barrel domain-containing protein [Micromonospora sp. ATCC 39149]EEP73785.1 MOSC domain-containing protein [Micromonospora sp. ATCC 39149]QLJ99690.1 MOSC domain-containing protein [Micromonospora carbonacea]
MRLTALYTYPVKGCRRLDHDAARVEPWGLAGDRRWMVVDPDGLGLTQREVTALVGLRAAPRDGGLSLRAEGHADLDVAEPAGGEPLPVRVFRDRLPVPALPAGPAADGWLGTLLGRPVRLVHLARPARHLPPAARAHDTGDQVSFADEYPLLLANAASLDALNGWLAEAGGPPVPMSRFRPNLVVSGAPAWAEDGWAGRRLRVGSAWFRAAGLCGRCVVTTTDQETGVRGKEPLRTLGRHRNVGGRLLFGLHLVPEGPGAVRVGDPLHVAAATPGPVVAGA